MDCSFEKITDEALVSACLHGDRHAYGQLICRYRDGVVNVVYRMCGDESRAEEAAQEAFIRAWQKLGSYKAEYSFRSWLYRIAVNQALDELRREKPTMDIDSEMAENTLVSEYPLPEVALIHKEQAERVHKAVLCLPEGSRAVVVLREYEGLAYQEIASALNIPLGTVMSRLSAARAQLRKQLIEAVAEPEVL